MAQTMQIEVIPEKPHIKISNKTINVPKELKYIATQFDHAAEKVVFDCPKIVGENINLLDTVLYVNYRLPDGSMSAHKAENVRVDETDEGIIHFDWTFTRNVTQYKGDIYFLVCAVKTDTSGNQVLRWSTTLNSEISVTEGIEGTETIDEQYPDIITQILQDLALKQNILVSGENIKTINGKSVLGSGDIIIDGEGTKNYNDLINKPRINGVELSGNRTTKELKIDFYVDTSFDPESENAQSGLAVNEATTELENKYFDVAYNMFNPETVTENTKISQTDGTETLAVGYSTSDYIELPTSGNYVAKSTEDYTFAIYTGENKRFLALMPAENPQSSIYFPDEMLPAFVRITFPAADINTVQINQGTTLLPYDDGRTKLRSEYYDTVSGKDGKSAYEIALDNGFEGSEEDWLASLKGEQGEAGKDGADGTSVAISSITESTEDSGDNVIIFSDGNSITVKNGSKGSKGDKGEQGTQGIQGVQGEKGETGSAGKDGTSVTVDVVSESPSDGGNNIVTFSDGSTLTVKNGNKGSKGDTGAKGADGAKGDDGISATHSWNGTVLTITSASGTSSADLKGEKGDKGEQGAKGETGAKGDKGNDGYTPVKGTDYYTEADKQDIIDEVVADLNGIPDYWQNALDVGVEAINTKLCIAGSNKSAFLFYSDAHYTSGSKMSPALLKYLYRHTGMTKTFFGGDIVDNESTTYSGMEYLWDWRTQLKDLPNHHSVVGNHDDGNTTNNLFSEQYVYGYLQAAEETSDIVRDTNGLYYYIDNPAERTRYLCLDTAYQFVTQAQETFIKNALIGTPDNWHIVVVSHIWYQPDYDQYSVRPIPIIGLSTDAQKVTAMLDSYNSRQGDYADCNGWVEFCIGGHVHRDYDGTTSTGIPIICVETDGSGTRGNYTYTAGTTTEASINGIIADYNKKTVSIIRIGRGISYDIALNARPVSYTNVIPLSVGSDGAVFNNGKGYADNSRIGSGGIYLGNGDAYVTGHIRIDKSKDNVIYLNNVSFADKGGIAFFDENYQRATVSASYMLNWITLSNLSTLSGVVEDGKLTKFTMRASDFSSGSVTYFAIQSDYIDDTSIITINEPIE